MTDFWQRSPLWRRLMWPVLLTLALIADAVLLFAALRVEWRYMNLEPLLLLVVTGTALSLWFPEWTRRRWGALLAVAAIVFAGQYLLLLLLDSIAGKPDAPTIAVFALVTGLFSTLMVWAVQRIAQLPRPTLERQLPRRALWASAAAGGLLLNLILVQHFNTLDWPYLWPRPMLYILLIGIGGLLFFPFILNGAWLLRIVGGIMLFVGECYLLHSIDVTLRFPSALAVIHLIGFTGVFAVLAIGYLNQITPRDERQPPPLPDELPHVAAVIPTYGEPYDVLEETLKALLRLDYPADRLHVLITDDAHRPEIERLANIYHVHYNRGAQRDAKAGNLNSALAYLAQHVPQAELILTQDADEVIHPSFLRKTVGFFQQEDVALVQTPKDAAVPYNDPFGTRQRLFYDVLQVGRHGSGAAFSCGSGVIWRLQAVRDIGGFATWNLVEDLTTSYHLHSAGWRSVYFNEILSIGLPPEDIPGLLKQRGTWALDNWRLFLFDNPLFRHGLTWRQRMQYLELGLFYVTSVLFTPLLMVVPMITLLTDEYVPIEGAALFPWVVATVIYYLVLARGRGMHLLRMWQYWVGHWPTYTIALVRALFSRRRKPKYVVTRKTREDGFYGYLLWPQMLYLLLGTLAIGNGLFGDSSLSMGTRLANIAVLGFFMYLVSAICRASFYGVRLVPDLGWLRGLPFIPNAGTDTVKERRQAGYGD